MRIAHITDIHATPDNGNLGRLRRVIRWLESLAPDLLVVTGDLVDDGWYEGYAIVEAELMRAQCRLLMLPGNADSREAMRHVWQETMRWPLCGALHFSDVINGVPVIGIDTTLPGETRGDIAPHLTWLTEKLASFTQPALIFTHHHLFRCGIAPIDEVMCGGDAAFWQVLAGNPVAPLAVCSGHVHRSMSTTISSVPAYICGSICPANPLWLDESRIPPVTDPAGLMIYDLRGGGLVASQVSV